MPYYASDPFALANSAAAPAVPSKRLTAADVEAKRVRLRELGLDGTQLDRLNDWRGDMVDKRDAMTGALKDSALSAVKSGLTKASM